MVVITERTPRPGAWRVGRCEVIVGLVGYRGCDCRATLDLIARGIGIDNLEAPGHSLLHRGSAAPLMQDEIWILDCKQKGKIDL